MNRGMRMTLLILAWGALIAAAIVFVIGPSWRGTASAVARPVPVGDAEIVWMNAATNVVAWERFVAAIRRLENDSKLKIVDESNAFPEQTTATPELAVAVSGQPGRLWFRWYKLTGDIGTSQWVDALLQRDPPPLAIVGGGSSDRARDLATDLQRARASTPRPPLLLFTTATADHVDVDGQLIDLMQIYQDRTFRFCFTNQQMADAMTDFVWSHDDFRPDTEPVYMVRWLDDPYSNDLFDRFREVISRRHGDDLRRLQTARSAASDWAWAAGWIGTGGLPPGLPLNLPRCLDEPPSALFSAVPIPYSEGDYSQPSFWDASAAEKLMDEYLQRPSQRRPLLVMPANPPSGRRFLRALIRIAPTEAGRFVVVSGDAIDFSTIYRDRRLAWHIQDLPITLLIFCHRNPAYPGAFQTDTNRQRGKVPDPTGKTSTSTQDLLLYQDIVESLLLAAYPDNGLVRDPDVLAAALREERWPDGRARFDDDGNQVGGSGEYVVSLEPVRHGDRVLPQALLRVWSRSPNDVGDRGWVLERRMNVRYFNPEWHQVPSVPAERGKAENIMDTLKGDPEESKP
jgi:hypothetical protein